jgi:hypothetical protein
MLYYYTREREKRWSCTVLQVSQSVSSLYYNIILLVASLVDLLPSIGVNSSSSAFRRAKQNRTEQNRTAWRNLGIDSVESIESFTCLESFFVDGSQQC